MRQRSNDGFDEVEIEPTTVAEYLISRGWTAQERIGDKATVWESESKKDEVWLPLRRDLNDYTRLLAETFQTLESVEHRSIRAIIHDLSLSCADLTRVHIDNGAFDDTLPLSGGISAITRARDIVLASSRSLVEPRPFYFAKPTGKVAQFLKRLRLGQTEPGSYIITIISPLNVDDPEFSRASIAQTYSAVQAAREASLLTRETNSLNPFDNLAEKGVSANLCEALADLGDSSHDGAVELKFTWSRQIERPSDVVQVVTIDSNLITVLRSAAEYLRTLQPVVDVELFGMVRDLSDRSAEDVQSEVTLLAGVFGTQRRVHFKVQGSDRAHAIAAFYSRLPILVKGTLDQSAQPLNMVDIRFVREVGEGSRVDNESEVVDALTTSLDVDQNEPFHF